MPTGATKAHVDDHVLDDHGEHLSELEVAVSARRLKKNWAILLDQPSGLLEYDVRS